MVKRFPVILLLFLSTIILAQKVEIKGIVRDSQNYSPLAFVNIVAGNNKTGTSTDIDGKFSMLISDTICCLHLSYMGYYKANFKVDYSKPVQNIKMTPQVIKLQEVLVFPGKNPAHRIIDSVMKYKKENDPRLLKAFTYMSYDKMVLTIKADSLLHADISTLDSASLKTRKFIEKQDFFILETVTERKYMYPDLNQENVIATKVSGFKDPMIVFMLSQIQSTTFYNRTINIFNKYYVNPISNGSKRKYYFQLEDTTYTGSGDTVFVISFRPLLHTRFNGLKGLLYVNTNKWALQNVKAEPYNDSAGIIVHIQQAYNFIEGHWFPVQLNTNIEFNAIETKSGSNSMPLMAMGKSYIRNVNLHPNLKKRYFGYHEVEINHNATRKKREFWKKYRVDSLTAREKETYRVIDSLGKAENFDKIASVTSTLIGGNVPFYFLNIDLDKFIHYNKYEGIYLGLGVHTNQELSKTLTIGGYGGYGFRDKTAKYGMNVSVILHKRSETSLKIEAYHNVLPSGVICFNAAKQRVWNTNDFYTFFYKRMNLTTGGKATISFRIRPFRDFKWYAGFSAQNKTSYNGYYFQKPQSNAFSHFRFRNVFLDFRFAFREKLIQTTKGYISLGSKYPVAFFKFTHGFSTLFNGDFRYNRFDLKIEQKLHTRYYGDLSYRLMAGKIFGDIPACNLYNSTGTYGNYTVFAPFSFSTMRPDEFLSNQYVALFISHSFKNLLFKGKGLFNPQLTLISNIAFGSLKHKNYHHNYNFKTLEKGYYESGFLIRKLLDLKVYDLGVGVLYRYGPYGLSNIIDNFAFKFSVHYGF